MRITISHQIQYRYSRPVFLEPHILRLRPRTDATQQLLSFHLAISPQPAGRAENNDHGGAVSTFAWFEGATDHLTVRADSVTNTLRANPFEFILASERFAALPMKYDTAERTALETYVAPEPAGAVTEYAGKILRECGGGTLDFISRLNMAIFENIHRIQRAEGAAWEAERTLTRGEGSCRDLTMLFIGCCRAAGLAARFVSGYAAGAPEETEKELHAWAEVYLPGGGWRGFDPARGVACALDHVAICSSAGPDSAAAVTGAIRGDGALASMDYSVHIREEPSGAN